MTRQDKFTKNISYNEKAGEWTFLTNHSHVLLCLADNPEMRLRDVAERVGITERAVQSIVQDLESAGVLTRRRIGRRNQYQLHLDHSLHHPVEAHCVVEDLIRMVFPQRSKSRSRTGKVK